MESKSEKWQLKSIGTMSFINDECDNVKQSDKSFFENIIRNIFLEIITDFKELEQTIENMKAIAGEKIEPIGGSSSVDYPIDNVTELIHRTGDLTHDFWYFCAECLENFEMDENFNYCPNCGRKIIRK